jgi:hypothetical protein
MRSVARTLAAAMLVWVAAARLAAQAPPEVKPGPEHEKFKQIEGVWDATIRTKEGQSKGMAQYKVGLGGLWLLEHFKGDFGGVAFEGMGATSYDAAKKKYVGVWIDSMSTSPMRTEGTFDKTKNAMTMVGEMPLPDGKSMKVSMVSQLTDENTMVLTMTAVGPDGKDFEMMKIDYKRKAK